MNAAVLGFARECERRSRGVELHPLRRIVADGKARQFVEPLQPLHLAGGDHHMRQPVHGSPYSRFIQTLLTCV
jgi:hypothetical protein